MKKLSLIFVFLLATTVVAQLAKPGSFWLWDLIMTLLRPAIRLLFEGILAMIRWNPRIFCLPEEIIHGCTVTGGIDKMMPYFLDILVPLYIIALMFTAMYFLVKGGSPRGRARAKAMLSKLFFSMVLVGMAPILYQAMLDISSALVEWISSEFLNMDEFKILSGGGIIGVCCILIVGLAVLIFAAIMVAVRYFFVLIFAVLFPFLLFLYFFDLTRGFGRKWLRRAVAWIFTPVVQTLFLVFTITSLGSITAIFNASGLSFMAQSAAFLLALVGMIMVAVTPLIMGKIYGFVGGGITAYGLASNTPWIAGAGALIEGRGENAIELTKSVLSRANYASVALGYAQSGSARSFGPSAPVPAFRATGGEAPSTPVAGKKSAKEAAEIASNAEIARARGGPTMARGSAPSTRSTREGAPRFSVGPHPVYSHELEMQSLRGRRYGISTIKDERRLGQKVEEAKKAAGKFTLAERDAEIQRGELTTVKKERKAEIPRARAEEKLRRIRMLKEGEAEEAREISKEWAEEEMVREKEEVERALGKREKKRKRRDRK